ncbi:MAG TPA: gephyrin-like molybdotransferase Glp [Rhodanobacter sp.]|nr:gephyrin-like molybdotransferase Glp [Rhodanobacter sp.]
MTLESALDTVLTSVNVVAESESVGLLDASGRILAQDVISAVNVPGHTNSAMDGYALRWEDTQAPGGTSLRVVGDSFAGHPYTGSGLRAGECVRIMTGAVVPESADTIIIQEDTQRHGDMLELHAACRQGEHVRRAGEDIKVGSAVLSAGRKLRAADLGLLASIGVPQVRVRRRVKVAYFSTGDELRAVGERLEHGQIHDSNRYTLHAMLGEAGVDSIDLGVVRDDPAALRQAFVAAAERADVVVTSGGASVGEADYVTDILAELGQVSFWNIAMKPGRPLVFGKLHGADFFGLPGNPVSVMVTFLQVVRPALAVMSGVPHAPPLRFRARAACKLHKKPGRVEFQRGILTCSEGADPSVDSTGHQGSGILRSVNQANCFIVLGLDRGSVEQGEWVTVEPFLP